LTLISELVPVIAEKETGKKSSKTRETADDIQRCCRNSEDTCAGNFAVTVQYSTPAWSCSLFSICQQVGGT